MINVSLKKNELYSFTFLYIFWRKSCCRALSLCWLQHPEFRSLSALSFSWDWILRSFWIIKMVLLSFFLGSFSAMTFSLFCILIGYWSFLSVVVATVVSEWKPYTRVGTIHYVLSKICTLKIWKYINFELLEPFRYKLICIRYNFRSKWFV